MGERREKKEGMKKKKKGCGETENRKSRF